jgi:hypothetical protein
MCALVVDVVWFVLLFVLLVFLFSTSFDLIFVLYSQYAMLDVVAWVGCV